MLCAKGTLNDGAPEEQMNRPSHGVIFVACRFDRNELMISEVRVPSSEELCDSRAENKVQKCAHVQKNCGSFWP
jgi:hypothetical protein